MKKLQFIVLILLANVYLLKGQITTNPAIFTANQAVVLTYDASQSAGQQLANLPTATTTITAHIGAILTAGGTTWTNVPGTWGDPAAQPKFIRQGTTNIYTLTLPNGIRSLFSALAAPNNTPIFRVGLVMRENGPCGGFGTPPVTTSCREGKSNLGQDIFLEVNQGNYDVILTSNRPTNGFVAVGETVNLTVVSNMASNLSIRVNGVQVASQTNATQLAHTYTFATGASTFLIEAVGTQGANTVTKSISYLIRQTPSVQAIPTGLKDGINYNPNDASKATLVFTAPEKKFIYVVGDFNNWSLDNAYLMRQVPNYGGSGAGSNPNNNKFWLEITGLTPGVEYGFQYWVYDLNENLVRAADFYSEKILDPLDSFILSATYPNLKPYPAGQQGAVSVLETGQQPYNWSQATLNFQKPDKKRLNIYEAWVYDFEVNRNFQNLIDRLDYLQNLGINVLQLMPIMEFNGNISWGYNPIFFCALDKAYGSKDKFKELIDKCHQRGIAVVLDIALNHAEFEFPGCKMYWNSALNRPAANSPWFNQVATHPFSVFQDFNHESAYTQQLTERVIKYWIEEYKIDGYRHDLAKGLTQTNSGDNIGLWGNYDASRVVILKRIADWQWQADNRSYVILEFLATGGAEEAEYANYRLNDPVLGGTAQGGMMLWRNMESNYAQNIMGFNSNHFLGDADFANNPGGSGTPFQQPRVISYMESHDEERVMYKARNFGNNSQAGHNVRNLNIALKRVEPAILFHAPVTGPKMMWQFGELGYDFSINHCPNGTINNNCRTDPKPLPWVAPQNYHTVTERMNLHNFYATVNQLKLKYDAFMTTDVFIRENTGLTKMLKITPQPYNPNPTNPNLTNVVIIANFDVVSQAVNAEFHTTGTWYSYFQNNAVFNATSTNQAITLAPGEYRFFTQVPLVNLTIAPNANPTGLALQIQAVTSVALTWANTITNNTGIRIKRRVVGSPNFEVIATAPANATAFLDQTVAENTNYEYQVEAFNLNGITNSNIASITTPTFPPKAPTNLILTNLTTSVASFSWTDNSTDEIGFILQRKTGAGGTYADLGAITNPNITSRSDNSIALNNTYIYRVGAVKGIGANETRVYSNEVTISTATPNATPNNLVATATSASSITLNWANAATNATGVRVARSLTSGGTFTTVVTLAANTINYIDINLNENTQYFYRVEVFNIFGSQISNIANATTPLAVPNAPTNLRITGQDFDSNTRIYTLNLAWNDNANNEQNYWVQRSNDANTGFSTLATLPANTTTYTDNTITVFDVIYFYRVIAVRSSVQVASAVINTGVISSTEDQTLAKFVKVSPNPTEERINIEIEKTFTLTKFFLIDMKGNTIAQGEFPQGTYQFTYLVKDLAQGQYLLQLFTNKGQKISKRFIKK